jgi:starch-binding outer membrane protein, SusD/RagB family
MKHIKIIFILLLTLSISSCERVLDQVPDDRIDLDKYFADREDAETALIGGYDMVLGTLVPAYVLTNSLSAGEMEQKSDITARAAQYRPNLRINNDGGSGGIWRNSYNAIARMNLLIERLPAISDGYFTELNVPTTRDRKSEVMGEARFLRAYVYYHLVQYFGDVPLVTQFATTSSPSANNVPRTPAVQVWQLIKEDLAFAEEKLPWNHNFLRNNLNAAAQRINTKGRATKSMAKLMIARIALKEKQWQLAADKAKEIMDSGGYTLNPSFQLTFLNTPVGTSQNSTESILEVQAVNPGLNNTGGIGTWEFVAANTVQVTDRLHNLYENGNFKLPDNRALTDPRDVRWMFSVNLRDGNIYNTDRSIRGISMFKYYNRDNTYGTTDPYNYVLGRLAEVYLIRAEALNELNPTAPAEVYTLINQLRARARDLTYSATIRRPAPRADTTVFAKGINPIAATAATNVIAVNTQANLRNFIREERWRELAFEGQQWFDLLRWDAQDGTKKALEVTYLNNPSVAGTNEGKLLFPIPDSERRINPLLTQNVGY